MRVAGILATGVLAAGCLSGQNAVPRPEVLGVAHIAVYVKDLAKARQFYEKFLGFDEAFTLPDKDGKGVRIAFVKVNDHQYIELFNEKDRGEGQLNHISLYTDSADRMYAYLKSRGAELSDTAVVEKDQTGNKSFNVKDPDGHVVELLQYMPDSRTARDYGKLMPATRISDHIMHVGVLCGDLDRSMAFYGGILGLREFWRGSSSPRMLSWVNIRPAEGQDYIELMLYETLPAPDSRGTAHHASLRVPDAEKALAELQKRAAEGLYTPQAGKQLTIHVGVNKKRQINLYDPDGTRIELMEPNTIDGKPAPNSTAPVPHPNKDN